MRTLVAGIGNVFLGDDAFGVRVAERLAREPVTAGVRVLDIGTRARHLAFELLDGGYDTAILVDALARGSAPGTLHVIEPEPSASAPIAEQPVLDGHSMDPDSVVDFVQRLGGTRTRILIVGCEPAQFEEGVGLSPSVAAAVEEAVTLLRNILACA
jgi:hydrogenase maturation protease